MKNRIYIAIASILVVASVAFLYFLNFPNPDTKKLRVAVPPFVDTAITAYGNEQGVFQKYGLEITLVDVAWEQQYELLSGGGLDIAMSTMSEFVNKDANLRRADRRVRFLFPAWQFLGLGFYTNDNFQTLASFEEEFGEDVAIEKFAEQLRGRIVVVPEGSVFEMALLQFLDQVGMQASDVRIINASLDSALNSLSDNNVVLVAVGSQQRFEAERRGYKEAIAPNKLGADVLTGFITRNSVYEDDREALSRFTCAWYDMLEQVESDSDKGYAIISSYLGATGAGLLSKEEYMALRQYNSFALNAHDARSKFLSVDGDAYWKRVWDRATVSLSSESPDAPLPPDESGFVAADILSVTDDACAAFIED